MPLSSSQSFFSLFIPTVKFDFEVSSHLPNVRNNHHQNSVSQTTNKFKEGSNSMEWLWSNGGSSGGEILEWNLTAKSIQGKAVELGGVKFHLYNTQPISGKCLKMCIEQQTTRTGCGGTTLTSCFFTSLNFKGWRAVWVSYGEFRGCQDVSSKDINCFERRRIEKFTVEAPNSTAPHTVYLDDLKFVDKIVGQTRDRIVPPIRDKAGNCFSCTDFASGITEADATERHPRDGFWNQAYRWDLVEKTTPALSPGSTPSAKDLQDLLTIKKRLLSWYVSDDIAFHTGHTNLVASRWSSLLGKSIPVNQCNSQNGNIRCSHVLYRLYLSGEGLYCKHCDRGKRKFKFVFHKILLPMAIDYHIWSRTNKRACMLAKIYGCDNLSQPQLDTFKGFITGLDQASSTEFDRNFSNINLQPSLNEALACRPQNVKQNCFERFRPVIMTLNTIKKAKILNIFKYVRDQGFAEGSSLGSLSHQMLSGSGYMHAAFLMADAINNANDPDMTLENLIDTMKWYSDFGEIYQTVYEYHGTTADRVRTFILFKLLTILSMPESNNIEKVKKIRDLAKLKMLMDNSLIQTEGTFGLLKPDFLGFHHQFYYGGYYVPDALHTMSFTTYLLDNTAFQLSNESKLNLKRALEFQRIVAVKYSVPPSVCGRYPFYDRVQLANNIPSYLYLAIESPTINQNNQLRSIQVKPNSNASGIYKRLMTPGINCSCPKTTCPLTRLCNGRTGAIVYLNTIGGADMIENVRKLLSHQQHAEASPRGNWAKNYAALSVHRRDDWAVTVKSFNHYVLGPERYTDQNVYGLFGAHGAMLIANDEGALKTKNVDRGWDWTKIPGTTAIEMTDDEIKVTRSSRYRNQKALAGGVSFYGTKRGAYYSNGVFGMDFEMPNYTAQRRSVLAGHSFTFKKSVFFFDNILVCLGSHIESSVPNKTIVTSLFQDTWRRSSSSAPPSMTNKFYCNNGHNTMMKYNFTADTILVDRNGNKYYIPASVSNRLKFHRKVQQNSKAQSGKRVGSGKYCKAWFDHGITPSNANYSYMIEVNAVTKPHNHAADTGNEISTGDYKILQQTDKVHTVKHLSAVCGHVIFNESARIPGNCSVMSASEPCMIMTKLTPNQKLEISISFPQMNFVKDNSTADPALCIDPLPGPMDGASKSKTSMLFCARDAGKNIDVTLHPGIHATAITSIEIDGDNISSGDFVKYAEVVSNNQIQVRNLKHGKSMDVEIGLT